METCQGNFPTNHGGDNFLDGKTRITIKAAATTTEAYFLIRWQDPSLSTDHLPLIRTEQGWQIQQNGFSHFNEKTFYEDKFAILLSTECSFGAANSAHLGHSPLENHPPNWHGKGYHYSTDGKLHDLWHWKAVRSNPMGLADDAFIGPPTPVYAGQRRYTAGYVNDAKLSGSYVMNWQWYKRDGHIIPKRLPKSRSENYFNQGKFQAPWFEYQRYTAESDTFPTGTKIPSVLHTSNRIEGDRADVAAKGVWENGHWTLELARKINTGSEYDIELTDGICMWFSAFDHSQIGHTRHTRPLTLRFQ